MTFDFEPKDYFAQCEKGLSLTGESREYFARKRLEFISRWLRQNGFNKRIRVLDYGCGPGDTTLLISEILPETDITVGVDLSDKYVEYARETYGTKRILFFTLQEFEDREQETFDLIYLNGVVHHVPPPERPSFFEKLNRYTKTSGIVGLFENNPLNPGTHLVMKRIPFDRDAVKVPAWIVRTHLRRAGFIPVYTAYLFFFPKFLSTIRPLERFLLRVPFGGQYGVIARKIN